MASNRTQAGNNPNIPIAIQRELRKVSQSASSAQDSADKANAGLSTKLGNTKSDLNNVSKYVSTQVQAGGQYPISLSSLTGQSGQNQLAYVPSVDKLPNRSSSLATEGQAVWYKNLIWRYSSSGGGTSTSSTQPGEWQASSPILVGTHAQRLAISPADYPDFLFYETDRSLIYVSDGTSWLFAAGGPGSGSFETRWSDLVSTDAGIEWLESSRSTINNQAPYPLYRWSGTAWVFVSGMFFRTQAQLAALAATLTTNDFSAQVYISTYDHQLAWSGSGWAWGTQESGGNPIEGFLVDPAVGWALCDGSATSYLNADGSVTSVTLPDLVSASSKAAYLKFGSPAGATPNAAVSPSFTGGSYTPSGTVSSTFTGSTGVPSGTVLSTFTGDVMGSHTHTESISSDGTSLYLASLGTSGTGTVTRSFTGASSSGSQSRLITGMTSAGTPTGNVSSTFTGLPLTITGTVSSTFTGASATVTGTVGSNGEPRNLVLRPWFRR